MIKWILISMLLFGCRAKDPDRQVVGIIIQNGYDNRIDLNEKTYTVYSINLKGDSVKIPLHLSHTEDSVIKDLFSNIASKPLKKEVLIEDKCDLMPKVFTTVNIFLHNKEILILKIDRDCEKFTNKNRKLGLKALHALSVVDSIISKKPYIENGPKSGSIYL